MKLEEFDFGGNLNIPLWIVYGHDCFPEIVCVAAKRHELPPIAVWGYSIYKRSPGFRTLGLDPWKYFKDKNANVFTDQDEAFEYLRELMTPKKKALEQLKGWT